MNYLQFNDRGKFEPEEQAVANYLGEGNYIGFYKKHFLRDKFQITKDDFIAGDIDVMFHAMKRLGIEYSYNDYPECLEPYLHRTVWEDTLGNVKRGMFEDLYFHKPVFIKPKDRLKRFTGFVLETIDDLCNCKGASDQTKIWCSEPVRFTSEFRCYFIDDEYQKDLFGEIYIPKVSMVMDTWVNPYKCCAIGSFRKEIDEGDLYKVKDFIREELLCIRDMRDMDRSDWIFYKGFPKAFALDLGVLSTGEVALIEMNDAFSIGKYNGIDDETYAKFLITRWSELQEYDIKNVIVERILS